jgi:Domain of unknown function (DUF4357)
VTTNPKGRSLELFFIDGRPDGMLTAEVFNWTGHVLKVPRTQISEGLKRKEARYTGVYILVGEKDGIPLVYIGEAEDVSDRIRSHDSKKDWWNYTIIVTSTANNLNKAHVRYLEACLIEKAKEVGRTALENGTIPGRPGLSEAAQSSMEVFLDYIFMTLPAIRIDLFLGNVRPSAMASFQSPIAESAAIFELTAPKHRIHATARLENGEFVVQAGSLARKSWESVGYEDTTYGQLHAELIQTGLLREEGEHRRFSENYAFRSPSAAAAVVTGRPSNGRTEWKVQGQRKTYKEWEAEKLSRDSREAAT